VSQYRAPKWGTRVTGCWLILYAADQFNLLPFHWLPVLPIVAMAAGILILTDH
jgi:hypothetical protein